MDQTHILEINLISAQGLEPPSPKRRRFKTYALVWVDSSCMLRSRLDLDGSHNPSWNDKFLFRVTTEFLCSDISGVSVQIYATGFIRDRLIGSARFLISNFLPGGVASSISAASAALKNPSFTALHIRRPSGCFQGILNVGVMLVSESDFPGFDGIWAMGHRDLMRRRDPDRGGDYDRSTSDENLDVYVSSGVPDFGGKKLKWLRAWIGGNFLCGLLPPSVASCQTSVTGKSVSERQPSASSPVTESKAVQNLAGKERLKAWSIAKLLSRLLPQNSPPSDQKIEIQKRKTNGADKKIRPVPGRRK